MSVSVSMYLQCERRTLLSAVIPVVPSCLLTVPRYIQLLTLVVGTVCYPFDTIKRRLMMQVRVPLHQQVYVHTVTVIGVHFGWNGL